MIERERGKNRGGEEEREEEREEGEKEEKKEGKEERINSGECLHSLMTINRGIFRLLIPSGIHSSPKKTY